MLGSVSSGFVSDSLQNRKGLTCLLYSFLMLVALVLLSVTIHPNIQLLQMSSAGGSGNGFLYVARNLLVQTHHYCDSASTANGSFHLFREEPFIRLFLFLAGFGLNGPKTLLIMLIADNIPDKQMVGTSVGVSGLMAQIGSSLAGIYIGSSLDTITLSPPSIHRLSQCESKFVSGRELCYETNKWDDFCPLMIASSILLIVFLLTFGLISNLQPISSSYHKQKKTE